MQYLYVVLDYGSSALKLVFSTELNVTPKYLTMQPEVIEIPVETIPEYRRNFNFDPVRYSFVGIDDRYYAVGELALKVFHSTLNLAEPKSNNAVQRTLAGIAVAARLAQIDTNRKFKVFLSCLLPPSELLDRDILENNLRKTLRDFDSPIGRMQVNLLYFNCHPEGGGLSLFYEQNREDLGDRSVGVIMMGHRNASCFTMQNEIYEKFDSTNLGFIRMVSDIKSATSGYQEKDITTAVSSYLLAKEEDKTPLIEMLLRNTQDGREAELDRLLQAIAIGKQKFWNSFSQWLTIQYSQIDEIIFGGGVAEIFDSEIVNHFQGKLPNLPDKNCPAIYLHAGLKYPSNTLIPSKLQARFADVQCLWEKDILPIANSYWEKRKKN